MRHYSLVVSAAVVAAVSAASAGLAFSSPAQPASAPASAGLSATPGASTQAAQTAAKGSAAAPSPTVPTPTKPPRPRQAPEDQIDCSKVACIALTFDDGPGKYTDQLLDILDAEGAKATFFVVGRNALAFPAQLQREVSLGMEVGDHTQDHADLTKLSAAGATAQIETCAKNIASVTGRRPTLLRPPYGAFTAGRTVSDGMAVILWSNDTKDWATLNTQSTITQAVAGARPGGIVLMHDIHPTTVAAVAEIIAQLRDQGYALVTVSKLLGGPQPGVVYRNR